MQVVLQVVEMNYNFMTQFIANPCNSSEKILKLNNCFDFLVKT